MFLAVLVAPVDRVLKRSRWEGAAVVGVGLVVGLVLALVTGYWWLVNLVPAALLAAWLIWRELLPHLAKHPAKPHA